MTDLRYALRLLRLSPGFATLVILTLAIGIGGNTAIVGLLDTVLRRELPVMNPQELVFIRTTGDQGLGGAPPYPYFERIRDQGLSFSGAAAFAVDELRVEVAGSVEQVFGQVVSGNYFQVLGLTPAVGRLLTVGDERLDPPVAVIGYGYGSGGLVVHSTRSAARSRSAITRSPSSACHRRDFRVSNRDVR